MDFRWIDTVQEVRCHPSIEIGAPGDFFFFFQEIKSFFFYLFILWLVKCIHTGELISCQSESRLGYEKWRKEKKNKISCYEASVFFFFYPTEPHLLLIFVVVLLCVCSRRFTLKYTHRKKEPCYLSLSLPCVYLTRMAGQTTHRRRLP